MNKKYLKEFQLALLAFIPLICVFAWWYYLATLPNPSHTIHSDYLGLFFFVLVMPAGFYLYRSTVPPFFV
ncbi:MAG: hypothetical protein ACRD3W_27500 [Terriglobales bacterium]